MIFLVAGHGDQIPNLDGTERDNKDESQHSPWLDDTESDTFAVILPLDWKVDESLSVDDRDRYIVKIIDDVRSFLKLIHIIFIHEIPGNE